MTESAAIFTAKQLADIVRAHNIPNLPTTSQGWKDWFVKAGISGTRLAKRGGGIGYHGNQLPQEIQSFMVPTPPTSLTGRRRLFSSNRKDTGILKTAEDGKLYDTIIALITESQFTSAKHIRNYIKTRFGEEITLNDKTYKLPSLRTFQRIVNEIKEQNAIALRSIQNPDAHRGRNQFAFGDAGSLATHPNAVWEIDASPADVLTYDGRLNLYAIIDVYTRRIKLLITKTPHCDAACKLIRSAIQDWGMPDMIITDNGADFKAKQIDLSLRQAGIYHDVSPPYTPQYKPFVERVIGTVQRDLMAILPGFCGHNVGDRQKIRERKAFADRLGESDERAFKIELTGGELQDACDKWVACSYHKEKHSSLGMSPEQMAAEWQGEIKTCADDNLLKMLFAPVSSNPRRKVTKKGVRYGGNTYGAVELVTWRDREVIIRHDPEDAGIIYLVDPEEYRFICEAVCPEMRGESRETLAVAMKKAGKIYDAESRAKLRKLTAQTPAIHEVALRNWHDEAGTEPPVKHNSSAAEIPGAKPTDNITYIDTGKADRIKRAVAIENAIAEGKQITQSEQDFITGYRNTSEYRVQVVPQLKPAQTEERKQA